jgi:hypothetical protein
MRRPWKTNAGAGSVMMKPLLAHTTRSPPRFVEKLPDRGPLRRPAPPVRSRDPGGSYLLGAVVKNGPVATRP